MGIYIKGMEMPTSCGECPLMEYDEETGCYCYLTNQYASKTRPDDCPLIEVPENRMFIIRDGIFYIETPKSPDGKTIILPPIESLWGG